MSQVAITGIRPGLTSIDVDAIDGSPPGTNQSIKFALSIPQFITIDDDNLDLDAFMSTNNFQTIHGAILDEARAVVEQIVLSRANVRLIWKSKGGTVPATLPPSMVTHALIGNTDPSGEHDCGTQQRDHRQAASGRRGVRRVRRHLPASFLVPAAPGATDIEGSDKTNQLAQVLASLQASDPVVEILDDPDLRAACPSFRPDQADEIFHTLLPVPFTHNVDALGNAVDTRDIMDEGRQRSFLERTGILALSLAPATFIDNLTDNGRAAIDGLVDPTHLASIDSTFPVPPVPPFDH